MKGLHKSKIDYIADSAGAINRPGYVLNIVTGCRHGCEWCYAWRMVENGRLKGHSSYPYGFEPTFHSSRFLDIGGKPKLIFLNDMGDVGGDWEWKEANPPNFPTATEYSSKAVAGYMRDFAESNPQHILLLLTKNPSWYGYVEWPENVWCGFSATNNEELAERVRVMEQLPYPQVPADHTWISLEPWLDKDSPNIKRTEAWLVIGGLSGPNTSHVSNPMLTWLRDDSIKARRFTKRNALGNWPDLQIDQFPREYPEKWKVTNAKAD